MKTILSIIALLALTAALHACSHPSPAQLVDQAELALANNDADAARACCRELSDMTDIDLTPSLLCRQALVYAHLAESGDDLQDMASAAKCMQQALDISIDSVTNFYRSIDVECKAQLELVKAIITNSSHGD